MLVDLYEATGEGFTLDTDKTPEGRARLFVAYNNTGKHDFLNDALVDAFTCAADANNLDRAESVAAFFNAVPENFSLDLRTAGLTIADHVAAIANAPGRTAPLSLCNAVCDYIQHKIEGVGLDAPAPVAFSLPVIKMVLASELAAEVERGEG
ncbi:MAG TPA: hypothetical protein VGB05_07680 [Pyrinomonadaceae bacterium]